MNADKRGWGELGMNGRMARGWGMVTRLHQRTKVVAAQVHVAFTGAPIGRLTLDAHQVAAPQADLQALLVNHLKGHLEGGFKEGMALVQEEIIVLTKAGIVGHALEDQIASALV